MAEAANDGNVPADDPLDYATASSQELIYATLSTLCGNGIVEVRCLGVNGHQKRTDAGYYDCEHFEKAAADVQQYLKDGSTRGVYFTLNPPDPALLARAANRMEAWSTTTTSDRDIIERRWLLVDCDPTRPTGISASDDEREAALQTAAEISEWTATLGLAQPITASSGNGCHLLYPIRLPNDDTSTAMVKRILEVLHQEFSTARIKVDLTTFNAARICRLYGTIARKGDNTHDRPHRMARLLHVPDYIERGTGEHCSQEALQRLAAQWIEPAKPQPTAHTGHQSRLLVDTYLQYHGIEYKVVPGAAGFTKYMLTCPFNESHLRPYVFQHADGAVGFKCSHDSCSGNKWRQFKERFKPDPERHYDPPLRVRDDHRVDLSGIVRPAGTAANDASTDDEDPPDVTERTYDSDDLNDIGNAQHYATTYKNDLRYCAAWGKWLVWDGTRWKIDDDGRPIKLAKHLVRSMFADAMEQRGGGIFEHACESAKASRLRAMIDLAAPELPIRVEELDKNGWILNCRNGVVNLKSGILLPHDRQQGITKLCPTDFVAAAESPIWNQFLRDVFADEELIEFVQRLFGYCLTGDVSEQKLALFYGTGANGKSTLLNAYMDTIGPDYTMQCLPDFLMEKKGETHPTEKASLFGKRFVSCVETEASRKLAESTVKMLTGGEKIMARRMREDFWEFHPSHKLVLCTNHRPIISGTDHGIWRRLLLVPFTQRFDGTRQDKQLPEKLRAERAGILAWAVRGCLEWQRIGLSPPASVCSATEDYRSSEDIFGRFIADCCVVNRSTSVKFSQLYERFEQWANDAGEFIPSKRAVGSWLDDNGYEKYSANGRFYRGLMLRHGSTADGVEDPFLKA